MSNRLIISGVILALILSALTFPQIAASFFLNLANTQIARAVSLPIDAPARFVLLADADSYLARAQSFSNQPRIALASARSALAQNEDVRALEAFGASGASLQNDSIAQFTWAEAAWRANQPDAAVIHLRQAGALEYFRQQMHRMAQKHEWPLAEQFARIAIGMDAEFAEGYLVWGDALSRQDVYDPNAIILLDRARELTRDKELVAAILSRKAEILASQEELAEAMAVFAQARQIAPTDARPRTGYAIVSFRLDPSSREQSEALLKEVVGDSPWYVPAYIVLSNFSELSGKTGDARTWMETGLKTNPNDPSLLFALGQFFARQNQLVEAKTTLILAMKYETHADLLQAISDVLSEIQAQ